MSSRLPIASIHVTGTSFPNDSGMSRQQILSLCIIGDPITLQREPTNKYDPHAVKVLTGAGQVGYVPAPLAAKLTDEEIGGEWAWQIDRLFGATPEKPTRGCRIAPRNPLQTFMEE